MASGRMAWLVWIALGLSVPMAFGQVGPPVGAPEPIVGSRPQASVASEPPADSTNRPPALVRESDIPLMAARRSSRESEGESATSGGGGWTRSLASVALVVGLILVLAAVARFASRRSGSVAAMLGPGGRAPSGVLEVLARYPVGRGQVLVLLRIDRRVLLLSQNMAGKGGGFSTLAQFDEPSEVAAILRQTRDESSESMSARFRQAMERFQGGDDGPGDGVDRGEIIEVGPRGEPLPKGRGVWA